MNNRLNKISIPLAFITAGAMLSACSEADEQTAVTPGDNAIRFAAGAEYASRAASDITTNNLSEFAVYAYTGSANDPQLFMNNVTVKKTASNTWTYSPLKYWPSEPVDFYAFAPEGWASTDGPLKPVEYYNFPGHTDLIYAVSLDNKGEPAANNAQVILNFRHALSKVTLNLSSSNTRLKVYVTNAVMKGLMMKGQFHFPQASTNTTTGTPAQNSIGTWDNLNTPYIYAFHIARSLDERLLLTTTPTDMSDGDWGGPKYLIPQTLTYRSEGFGNDSFIAIMCSIYDAETGTKLWPNDNTPPENIATGSSFGDGILKFPLSTTQFSAWQPGYHYIYNLIINANPEMGAINFGSPTVDTFIDVESNYN